MQQVRSIERTQKGGRGKVQERCNTPNLKKQDTQLHNHSNPRKNPINPLLGKRIRHGVGGSNLMMEGDLDASC